MSARIDHDALDVVYENIQRHKAFRHLREDGNRFVPGEGDTPKVFILGEAPGAREAEQLRPFVGPSGKLLRLLMHKAGLYTYWHGKLTGAQVIPNCREGLPPNVWLTNVLKYRPAGNRTPDALEIRLSRPFVRAEYYAVGAPRVIVPVGAPAMRTVMADLKQPITMCAGSRFYSRVRGTDHNVMVVPMLHPSFLLRAGDSAIERAIVEWSQLGSWVEELVPR
jgi:DNA polymerase